MHITRREFLTYSAAAGAAIGLTESGLFKLNEALAANGAPPVIWLQAQNCTGCSVSLLNSAYYTTIDDLLLNDIDLKYHTTVMAAAGDLAVNAAEPYLTSTGHVLVVEGAIPTAAGGQYCMLWSGMTALDGVKAFAKGAAAVLALGTCAAYGGVAAGKPNPTGAQSVTQVLGSSAKVINVPGCPAHPDWIVGTIAYFLTNKKAPPLDSKRRPTDYFGRRVHSQCPRREYFEDGPWATWPGGSGCLRRVGCNGPETYCDCPKRQWNSVSVGGSGVNWCIGANAPCQGCTEPDFPDGKSPFYARRRTDD